MSSSLPNDIEKLKEIITELLAKVDPLEAENAELRRRLGLKVRTVTNHPAVMVEPKNRLFLDPKINRSGVKRDIREIRLNEWNILIRS